MEKYQDIFLWIGLEDFAYIDKAYPIAASQTISQPYTVAFQTQLLELKKGDKVLEIDRFWLSDSCSIGI